jgi:hypothetical protein
MTDVVFFLKSPVPKGASAILPGAKLIAIDPPASLMCGGSDPRCSTAYSNMWQWLRGSDGRVMPNLLAKYAPGISVNRVAFVGFSAAHGFLNPLTNNDADREAISALLLLDATFGGGKSGYVKFVEDAARGERLLVTTTSNTGGDESWKPVWKEASVRVGDTSEPVSARSPMPEPSGGVWRLGQDAYYYRFVDAKGQTELPHWEMHHITNAVLEAHLAPYWSAVRWPMIVGGAIAVAGAAAAWRIYNGAWR